MSWDSRYLVSGRFALAAALVGCMLACSRPHVAEFRGKVTQMAIFASTGNEQYVTVLLPPFMESLYGADWYKQSIFVQQSSTNLGQSYGPILIWKLDGLVFQEDKRGQGPDDWNQPKRVTFYSLEKKLAYTTRIDFIKQEIKVTELCHCEDWPEEVLPSGALYPWFKCNKWEKLDWVIVK